MDTFNATQRSEVMRRVQGKNTKPEMAVRRLVHGMGFRYSLHNAQLPGKPDLVLTRLRKVLFVHGCFWHGHACRAGRNRPASNLEYWTPKLQRNRTRDRRNAAALRRLGWDVLVIWECQLKDAAQVSTRIARFLGSGE